VWQVGVRRALQYGGNGVRRVRAADETGELRVIYFGCAGNFGCISGGIAKRTVTEQRSAFLALLPLGGLLLFESLHAEPDQFQSGLRSVRVAVLKAEIVDFFQQFFINGNSVSGFFGSHIVHLAFKYTPVHHVCKDEIFGKESRRYEFLYLFWKFSLDKSPVHHYYVISSPNNRITGGRKEKNYANSKAPIYIDHNGRDARTVKKTEKRGVLRQAVLRNVPRTHHSWA
jgi:hypothetical protein